MISSSSPVGRNSVMARATIDFPVPGSPISMTWRFCSAAFLMMSTVLSWPMTWSMRCSGTSISSVVLNLVFFIHWLIGGRSSGGVVCSLGSFVGNFAHRDVKILVLFYRVL